MVRILTSHFPNGFSKSFARHLNSYIKNGMSLAFVASEFEDNHAKNDWYCGYFMGMFADCGITFNSVSVIDSRLSKKESQEIVINSDVIWLAGGDTPTQFDYLCSYEIDSIIQQHNGVIIGMSAGSINMTRTALCTITCDHKEQKIYEALGLVEFSIEPHFNSNNISEELFLLSYIHPFYGITDDSAIIYNDNIITFCGKIFYVHNGVCEACSPME